MQKFGQGLQQCIDCHGGHLELSKTVMADCNIILVTPQNFSIRSHVSHSSLRKSHPHAPLYETRV
jgi:hypothetical protein